jgi:predicted RNase H-like nuclease
MNLAGIDGCRLGWICIFEELPTRHLASKIFPTVDDLAKHIAQLDVVAIDVPIGLTDSGPRGCDAAARKMLGPKRASSVFPAPIRAALGAATYDDACTRSFDAQGKKLSKQAWAIYPKIRELDTLLRVQPELCGKVYEVHPEVSFCAWNAMEPIVEPKKSREGAAIRRQLIARHFGEAAFDTIRTRYKRKDVADDDIMDAVAALWTAERIASATHDSLPNQETKDSLGLPMRMIDETRLNDFMHRFYGYGSWDAPLWFVGMEEGGGNTLEELELRLKAWDGSDDLADLKDFHAHLGGTNWFSSRPKIQSTWGNSFASHSRTRGGLPTEN